MGKVSEAIGKYFEERNRAWITGNIDKLLDDSHASVGTDWVRALQHHIGRKRQSIRQRNSQLLRAHSKIAVRKLEEEGNLAKAEIVERVTWVYRDGLDYGAESRLIEHVQTWQKHNKQWYLTEALETDERTPFFSGSAEDIRVTGKPRLARDPYPDYLQCRSYDRVRAQRYADLWWNSANPAFVKFEDDCTNFASQCLYAAGMRMHRTDNDRTTGWWYDAGGEEKKVNWSYSWSTSYALYLYLVNTAGATQISDPQELNIGDLVFYDWDGSGHFHHTTVVTDFDNQGDPLVNAHSDASFHRHYLYLDSRAWTPQTRYAYVHLPKEVC